MDIVTFIVVNSLYVRVTVDKSGWIIRLHGVLMNRCYNDGLYINTNTMLCCIQPNQDCEM